MEQSDKKKWVQADIDEDTHRTLRYYATEIGDHPSKIVGRFIVEGLEKAAAEAKAPSLTMRTFLATQKALHKEQILSQLGRIAWSAITFSDEESFEMLEELCQEYGITVEEIVNGQQLDASPPLVVRDNGKGIASAAVWLQSQYKEIDHYPSNTIMAMGRQVGFSNATLQAAKKRAGLVSIRASSNWVWAYPDYNPNANENGNDPF